MTIRKFIWALGTTVLLATGLALTFGPAASATYEDPPGCEDPVLVPSQWWNWSPNHDQGPFDGPPDFPTDSRGTWEGPHTNGGPAGTGTYQTGAPGNGDWFHRNPEVLNPDYPCATTVPPTTQTPPTSSIPDDDEPPSGSIDVDKTVHGDPDCEDGEPCFVIEIDCEDLDFTQVYDRDGDLIEGDSTYHNIPPGTVCIVTETETGGADAVTYDPANANTTGVVITAEDPDNGRDQRVHVMVTNDFDECEVDCVPVTTVPPTTVPPTTIPPTTVPPTTEPPPTTVPCEPPVPNGDDCVPPTTVVPPPTTVVPPPPSTVPTCADNPDQNGCARESLPRTGGDHDRQVKWGLGLIAVGLMALLGKKRLTA